MNTPHRLFRVFLAGPHDDPPKDAVRNPDKSLSKWRHQEVSSVADADLIFWWATQDNARSVDTWFQLGQSIALDRAIIAVSESVSEVFGSISAATGKSPSDLLQRLSIDIRTAPAGSGIRFSYERYLADMDVLKPSRFVRTEATEYCRCAVCGGNISKGQIVVRSAFRGIFHVDCHAAKFDSNNLSETVFNSRLIETLREENARLEQELEKYRRHADGSLHK